MNLLNRHFKLFLKNWKLGLMVFATASLFLLPAIFISAHYDVNSWWFILASLITAGTALAFFVAETQKELMSRGTGFLLPGLGSTVFSVQIITMSAFTLIAFLVAFSCPVWLR